MHQNWKKHLRSILFGWLPPKIYLKIIPFYFKVFNKRRRGCSYTFNRDSEGRYYVLDEDKRFYFVDHRRVSRYLYPDGLNKIKKSIWDKYTNDDCTINNGDIVVEIGANVGEFTLVAAEKAQKVYAFEPDPNCVNCLNENVRHLDNVEIIEMGVSNIDGEKIFYLSSEDADSSFIIPDKYTEIVKIQSIRLDSWVKTKGLSKIDFLKLEAEGGELEVLEGLANRINDIKKISADTSPERQGQATSFDVKQYLLNKRFQTKLIGNQVFGWEE